MSPAERSRPFSVVWASSGAYIPGRSANAHPDACLPRVRHPRLVANELTPQFAEQLGRGFGRYLVEKNPGAQSMVARARSPPLQRRLAAGFSRGVRSHGIDVISIGVVPTPLTYFARTSCRWTDCA